MENINKLYIIPNYECNLKCPHCNLHKINENYNEEKFLNVLNTVNCNEIILFGGEPLLYKNRFKKILDTNKITSISTNLLNINQEDINNLKKYNINIATSWNMTRFTKKQETLWINNLNLINKNNIPFIILITLTEDLIDSNINNIIELFNKLNNLQNLSGVLFEQLLDYTKNDKFYARVDDWLIKINNNWKFNFKNLILEKLKNWNCNCNNIFTLTPSGVLKKGCPQYTKSHILTKCLSCELASVCKPCILQKECTFPKKLYLSTKGN